ncbi:MAG: hypothetical protein MJZ11_08515 [Lachnospiraceae bacterium]|nr:hypothetical protein [Lachnospiraceae bacterium]
MYNFDKKYISTHTLADCLEEYECAYETLRLWCLFHKVKYLKNKKEKKRMCDEKISQYVGKMSDRSIAKTLGISRNKVFQYRLEHNIKPYGKHTYHVSDNIETILDEYNELGSLQKVADKHGVTREAVRQWFASAGYHYVKNQGYVK